MKSLSLTPWRGPIFETLKPRNMIANETARERNTANKAAVSIIVLSYNRPAYLRSALESVAAQTERSIEVIAADDGSPDLAVDAVLEEFRARFDRYVYERAERNVGVVANLLRAVRRSSGTYVAVLSDDDVLEPAFAERLRATLDASPSHCAAFCNVRIIDAAGNIDPGETAKFTTRWSRDNKTSGTIDDFTSAALVTRMFQPAMGAMIRKSAIEWDDFPEQVAGAWDTWLAYLCARTGTPGTFVAEPLFRYRQHAQTLTARRDLRWYRGLVHVYLRCRSDPQLGSIDGVIRGRLERYHTELGMALLRLGQNAEAGEAFRLGRSYGRAPKLWAGSLLSRLPSGASRAVFRLYDR
jgi:glycosyltransferase involved in cell wall biosynthesis